jgi:hypothetical protein
MLLYDLSLYNEALNLDNSLRIISLQKLRSVILKLIYQNTNAVKPTIINVVSTMRMPTAGSNAITLLYNNQHAKKHIADGKTSRTKKSFKDQENIN